MNKGRLFSFAISTLMGFSIISQNYFSDAAFEGIVGDINKDMNITSIDVMQLGSYILDISTPENTDLTFSDIDKNDDLNAVDLCLLKRLALGIDQPEYIYSEETLIDTPISTIDASCPSTGDVKMLIFEIEFPDCQFTQDMSAEEIENTIFGSEDTSSSYYPYESVTAYLNRSSYGRLNMTGDVFTYTASGPISDYNDDKVKLVKEVLEYFNNSIDYTEYDADNDGYIDCSAYFVPSGANEDYWWPCSGGFGDPYYEIDGVRVGNIMTGNSVPTSRTDFVTTIIHEMGHTMGLPDYYKYSGTSDWEGLKGNAGYEMMDDAYGDYSSFSKLMLGWYQEDEISVYDKSKGTQTFNLASAQHSPNFVIIPGDNLGDDYFGEYFIIEYVTADKNNTIWWNQESGIRILHVQSEIYTYDYWGTSVFAYDNYGPLYNGDDGIRVLRLVNDNNGYFTTGSVVNSSVSGFAWYDSNGNETVDTGLTVNIGNLSNGEYTITISNN